MDKLIITCAMVGAELTLEQQPHLPILPEQVARAAEECWRAGASIIHLHVRDPKGAPSQDPAIFAECQRLIAERTDLILQYSTGGAVTATAEERIAPLINRPEMASLTTGTCNFGDDVFMNSPEIIRSIATALQAHGVKPELEVFEVGMIQNALQLVKEGLVTPPLHFDLVMGVPGSIPATPGNLMYMINQLPAGATWTAAAVGRHQLPLNTLTILLGGHVRMGFEDNIYYSKGVLAHSNAQFVERVVRLAKELGREVATPAEARRILGMAPRLVKTLQA